MHPDSVSPTSSFFDSGPMDPTSIGAFRKWQREIHEAVSELKHQLENKNEKVDELSKRVATLERESDWLRAQRNSAVTELLTIKSYHQEAATELAARTSELREDDLEGALAAWATAVNKAMNHLQRRLHNVSTSSVQFSQAQQAPTPIQSMQAADLAPQTPLYFTYPSTYYQNGYCMAHGNFHSAPQ
ncbi:hypothetical protein N0V90_003893 [Kalmusia sp. IMI 367209]|nr:hypothetical protein N0V90_003893 [Kalmusia sp. IMI 367209]